MLKVMLLTTNFSKYKHLKDGGKFLILHYTAIESSQRNTSFQNVNSISSVIVSHSAGRGCNCKMRTLVYICIKVKINNKK